MRYGSGYEVVGGINAEALRRRNTSRVTSHRHPAASDAGACFLSIAAVDVLCICVYAFVCGVSRGAPNEGTSRVPAHLFGTGGLPGNAHELYCVCARAVCECELALWWAGRAHAPGISQAPPFFGRGGHSAGSPWNPYVLEATPTR